MSSRRSGWARAAGAAMALTLLSCGGAGGSVGTAAPTPITHPGTAFVYSDLARDPQARAGFFAFARSRGITRVFLESQVLLLSAQGDLATFVREAKAEGIATTMLTGSTTWALAAGHAEAVDLARRASAFTKGLQDQGQPAPEAIQFDVEPYLLSAWNRDLQGTANQYLDLLDELRAALEGQPALLATVPYWYETRAVTRLGRSRPLSEWVIEAVDGVVVMDYRDTASRLVSGAADEVAFAAGLGKSVVVAVSVDPDGTDGSLSTFADDGEAAMLQVLAEVRPQFAVHPSFRGFAVFCYEDWARLKP